MVLAPWLFATMGVTVKMASALCGTGEIVFYRGLSGVCALMLWFYSIGQLPLATAVTQNYMSSVWLALFLLRQRSTPASDGPPTES